MPYFLLPQLACVALLFAAWQTGLLKRPGVVAAIVVAGVTLQWLAPIYSALWVAALLLNVVTAVCLAVRIKLD